MLIETRPALQAELESLRLASRQLSRTIGQAKQAGQSVSALVEQKRVLSQRERELKTLLNEDAGNPPLARPESGAKAANAAGPASAWATANCSTIEANNTPTEVALACQTDWHDWDAFVEQHPGSSVYHLSGWRGVIQRSFGHDCPYLLAKRSGQLVGVMPLVRMESPLFGHFMVSMPYFNYGGALSCDATTDQALTCKAIELATAAGCRHVEWREGAQRPGFPARADKANMWLDLPADADSLWQSLGSKLRAQIKKAQTAGLTYETGGLGLLDEFYRVFSINMRDLGTPVYGKNFFKVILRDAPGQPLLVIGRTAQGQAVSAALLLRHGSRMEVPWASTLRKANTLNANMGLYWHMLSYACQASCSVFDFGRSTKDAATYRFKKQWGARPVESYWNYWLPNGVSLPKISPDNPKYRAAIAVWKVLPLFLTQQIGPLVAKHIP
jgi:serine/alanine adding enzyme